MKSAFEWMAAGGALDAIVKERLLLDAGGPPELLPMLWTLRLLSSFSRVEQSLLAWAFNESSDPATAANWNRQLRDQAVQAAAELVAFIECIDLELEKKRLAKAMGEGKPTADAQAAI